MTCDTDRFQRIDYLKKANFVPARATTGAMKTANRLIPMRTIPATPGLLQSMPRKVAYGAEMIDQHGEP